MLTKWIIRCYPRAFRARFGDQIMLDLEDAKSEHSGTSRMTTLRWSFVSLMGLLSGLLRAHAYAITHPSQHQYAFAHADVVPGWKGVDWTQVRRQGAGCSFGLTLIYIWGVGIGLTLYAWKSWWPLGVIGMLGVLISGQTLFERLKIVERWNTDVVAPTRVWFLLVITAFSGVLTLSMLYVLNASNILDTSLLADVASHRFTNYMIAPAAAACLLPITAIAVSALQGYSRAWRWGVCVVLGVMYLCAAHAMIEHVQGGVLYAIAFLVLGVWLAYKKQEGLIQFLACAPIPIVLGILLGLWVDYHAPTVPRPNIYAISSAYQALPECSSPEGIVNLRDIRAARHAWASDNLSVVLGGITPLAPPASWSDPDRCAAR